MCGIRCRCDRPRSVSSGPSTSTTRSASKYVTRGRPASVRVMTGRSGPVRRSGVCGGTTAASLPADQGTRRSAERGDLRAQVVDLLRCLVVRIEVDGMFDAPAGAIGVVRVVGVVCPAEAHVGPGEVDVGPAVRVAFDRALELL